MDLWNGITDRILDRQLSRCPLFGDKEMSHLDIHNGGTRHNKGTPTWTHDCERCHFLGHTIGGGRRTDLYVCDRPGSNLPPTLIARFGDEGSHYYSTDANYAHATGHAELFAAAWLWRQDENRKLVDSWNISTTGEMRKR